MSYHVQMKVMDEDPWWASEIDWSTGSRRRRRKPLVFKTEAEATNYIETQRIMFPRYVQSGGEWRIVTTSEETQTQSAGDDPPEQ